MNGLYKTSQSLQKRLLAVGFEVVSFGDNYKVDLDRQTIFPYGHIVPTGSLLRGSVTDFSYTISGMDTVDFNKDKVSNFFNNDNMQDVLNDIHNRLSQLVQYYQRSNKEAGITSIEVDTPLDAFTHRYDNLLTGWALDITLTVPTGGSIC
jgi:hypothetical protein